jgi:hypothetical protein
MRFVAGRIVIEACYSLNYGGSDVQALGRPAERVDKGATYAPLRDMGYCGRVDVCLELIRAR